MAASRRRPPQSGAGIISQCCGRPRVASKVCLWCSHVGSAVLCGPFAGRRSAVRRVLRTLRMKRLGRGGRSWARFASTGATTSRPAWTSSTATGRRISLGRSAICLRLTCGGWISRSSWPRLRGRCADAAGFVSMTTGSATWNGASFGPTGTGKE